MRRSWFGTAVKQNKSPSLDLLKSLYSVLVKNAIVTDHNRTLIVEVLRSIAETVIWGDQNDPRVFDFFLEKGIQSYFLSIIEQPKCGTYVCTQLLQTLNILFENIRNETSIYFLLSNNHVNSIICHEFDFSDEEIMAYYISFLKTLSLKLNRNTIHFFYNEHLRDFPLYTEAIKFFNHSESMVRIAVRTLTLNVYRVGDETTLKFIHDKTAAPYFSNLVWFIGNNVLMMERCLRTEANHLTRNKLESLVALHLDDMHYVHDILQLQMQSLNNMLCEHLLNTLLIPLYVYSLDPSLKVDSPQVSVKCALFLLSQVFLILSHPPLVKQLKLYICFEENPNMDSSETVRRFMKPSSQIADTLKPAVIPKNKQNLQPTPLAKEHKEELKAREARRIQEENRLKELDKYQKKQKFNQTGYLKSILDPDPGTDPLLGARVHRVDSLKKLPDLETRSRESSSKESSLYSEAVYIDSEEGRTESFTELARDTPEFARDEMTTPESRDAMTTPESEEPTLSSSEPILLALVQDTTGMQSEGPSAGDQAEEVSHPVPDYPVSEDSGIVSETMDTAAQDVLDDAPQQPEIQHPPDDTIVNSDSTQTLSAHGSTESSGSKTYLESTPEFQSPVPESPQPVSEGEPTSACTPDQSSDSSDRYPESPDTADNGCHDNNKAENSCHDNTQADNSCHENNQAHNSCHDNNQAHNSCHDNNQAENSCHEKGNSTDKSDNDTTLVLTDQEVSDVNKVASNEDALFTPPKRSDASHFADAFHCPPTRSCIFYDALLSCLEVGEDDVEALFSAILLYAMFTNKSMPHRPPAPYYYDDRIVDRLLNILDKSCHVDGIVRLVTLEIAIRLLRVLTSYDDKILLQDYHVAVLTAVKENSVRFLRSFYTGEDNTLFVELFDEEYKLFNKRRETNVAHLVSDECMLLGPVYTPLTGIDFTKRLPCGDLEKMRKSLIVFFSIRKLWQEVLGEEEAELPLLNLTLQVAKGDVLNLNHSDLIACAVATEHDLVKRFLVIDTHQLILVEPDNAPGRLGWGIVQFVAPLQSVDTKPDKDNNRNLLISIEKSSSNTTSFKARFQFEDHIRCFAAKTRLKQGRESLQKLKGFKLSHILDMPDRQSEEPFLGSTARLQLQSSFTSVAGPKIGKSGAESGVGPSTEPARASPEPSNVGRSAGTPSTARKSLEKLPAPEVV